MDILADVFEVTKLANTIMCQAKFVAPWAANVDKMSDSALHVTLRGTCWLRIKGEKPLKLSEGDIVLLTQGQQHIIADSATGPAKTLEKTLATSAERMERGDVDPSTVTDVLCAKYRFGLAQAHPVLSRLPSLVHLSARETSRNAQLQLMLQLMRMEATTRGAGSELLVPRLVDSMLVLIIRTWLETDPGMAAHWFSAIKDERISKALALIHQRPEHDWTVSALAESCGLSRATFARRFNGLVGETPIAYLVRWRLCVAARRILDEKISIEQVAYGSGFESPAAFSKAFKRQYGEAPSHFRVQMV